MKDCHTKSCPFAFTDESDIVQNYGCLPTGAQIVKMRVEKGKTWACHSNYKRPCLGALKYLKTRGLPYKIKDTKFITEKDDWEEAR